MTRTNTPWSEDEVRNLLTLARRGLRIKQIASYFPDRTLEAVHERLHILSISLRKIRSDLANAK